MRKSLFLVLLACLAYALSSCVHEWPEFPNARPVTLTLTHLDTEWDLIDHKITRGFDDLPDGTGLRYVIKIYHKGDTVHPVVLHTVNVDNPSFRDVTVTLDCPPGDFDVYVWSDYTTASNDAPLCYNADNFRSITYLQPYRGNTITKDAFRGNTSISIPDSYDEDLPLDYVVPLRRPITAYAFVASDLRQFVLEETTRRGIAPVGDAPQLALDFTGYKVQFTYSGFLPNVFNNFTNVPINSTTGVTYSGPIIELNSETALLGFDYFFINGESSSIVVGFTVYDPTGTVVAGGGPYTIPVKKNHCTVVHGEFLTSTSSSGIGINPAFDGEFNIQL